MPFLRIRALVGVEFSQEFRADYIRLLEEPYRPSLIFRSPAICLP